MHVLGNNENYDEREKRLKKWSCQVCSSKGMRIAKE